jgi:hypothetical protein
MVVGCGVHLLGVEPERAAQGEQVVEEDDRVGLPTAARESLYEPERARQEGTFTAG